MYGVTRPDLPLYWTAKNHFRLKGPTHIWRSAIMTVLLSTIRHQSLILTLSSVQATMLFEPWGIFLEKTYYRPKKTYSRLKGDSGIVKCPLVSVISDGFSLSYLGVCKWFVIGLRPWTIEHRKNGLDCFHLFVTVQQLPLTAAPRSRRWSPNTETLLSSDSSTIRELSKNHVENGKKDEEEDAKAATVFGWNDWKPPSRRRRCQNCCRN